jgi:hypothetical protein
MVKYKMGFTIESETLFRMMSQFLPIQDLHVEEIIDKPILKAPPISVTPRLMKPLMKKSKKVWYRGRDINLNQGANRIIMEYLSDGKPHKAFELKTAFINAALSPNGVGSALAKMEKRGFIFQPGLGLWQLNKEYISQEKKVV